MADDGSPAPREFHPVTDPGAPARPAIHALIEKWRKDRNTWPPFSDGGQCARKVLTQCADQLEAALRASANDRAPARQLETALVRDMESRIQELNGHAAVHRTMREWAHEESALARANEVWKWLTRLKSRAAAVARPTKQTL